MWKVQGKIFLRESWKKYIFVVVVILIQCISSHNLIGQYVEMVGKEYELHIADFIAEFFKGTISYTMSSSTETFNIPPFWSLYYIYFVLLIGRATNRVSQKYEQQMILRCVSRRRWWIERNIEIWMETIGYVAVTGLTFFVYGICTGAELSGINTMFQSEYNGLDISQHGDSEMILILCIASFFVMLVLAYIQYVVSMVGNAVIGIIISVVVLVSSVYHLSPLLIGNYMMLIRQDVLLKSGIDLKIQIMICMAFIIVLSLYGQRLAKKKDLF